MSLCFIFPFDIGYGCYVDCFCVYFRAWACMLITWTIISMFMWRRCNKARKHHSNELRLSFKMAEVEETIKRIQSQKGVQGIIIVNAEGIPIKSTLDNSSTVQYAGNVHQLLMKARGMVRDIDPQNDLTFLRVRSKKNEIMIAPDKDYFLIVIQNPTE
ncbi:dynein light chain roadblock-type 1 isoform X2 [Onychostoma macrolepis]|uniref:dynein light chain roadblock-type 1 isoform X2 n=1 Tax=Onychostoma macrolepis TaxID=369639 RepID=UPI00272BF65B|nr:dynein light chain roadblock-type 1 isoform X2 [Onychostoma macrolepis]